MSKDHTLNYYGQKPRSVSNVADSPFCQKQFGFKFANCDTSDDIKQILFFFFFNSLTVALGVEKTSHGFHWSCTVTWLMEFH